MTPSVKPSDQGTKARPAVTAITLVPEDAVVRPGQPARFAATVTGEVDTWAWRILEDGFAPAEATTAGGFPNTFTHPGTLAVVELPPCPGPGGTSDRFEHRVIVTRPRTFTLTVTITGAGSVRLDDGTMCSAPGCPVSRPPGTDVTLTACRCAAERVHRVEGERARAPPGPAP